MEEIYKYLDKVKAEMEKLQDEYQTKSELFECLKKVHEDQLVKFQEAQLEIEKKARVIDAKSEEISEARKNVEFLTSSLHEKELSLKHLSSENDKLHDNFREKLHKLEEENKEILMALDESSSKNKELTQELRLSNEQIVGLKRLLLDSEKKCLDAEKKAQASEEIGKREDIILKLEQDNRNVQEQLKWKQEQFNLLEKAHESFQTQFHLLEEESEREKTVLLEEISSSQINLDYQIRISEDLQTRLEMCTQALDHEESRRKLLEAQVSELESRFENLFNKSLEEKAKLEKFTSERHEEIEKLRNLAANKEEHSKEMNFKICQLEIKNWELEESHKVLEEAENSKASDLLKEMHDKIKGLEQELSNCFTNLKEREFEWISQMEQLKLEVNSCECEIKMKEKQIREVQMEVESLHSAFEILNKANIIMLVVLQSEFSEAYLNLINAKSEMELIYKEKEDKIRLLRKQLEMTNGALSKTHLYLEEYHKQVASFLRKVELPDLRELQPTLLQEGLDGHREIVEQEQTVDDHKQIVSLEAAAAVKTEAEEAFINVGESLLQLAEEEVDCKDYLQKAVIYLKQKPFKRDSEGVALARIESEQLYEQEKVDLFNMTNKEEQCTKELQKQEQNPYQKLSYQEFSSHSKEEAMHHQAFLEANDLEAEISMNQFRSKQKNMEGRVEKLVFEGILLQDAMKKNAESENILAQIEEIYDQIDELCCEDVELTKLLQKMLHICEEDCRPGIDMKASNELCDSEDKADITFCPSTKKFEARTDERAPLKEPND